MTEEKKASEDFKVKPKIIFDEPKKRKKTVRHFEFLISAGLWVLFLYFVQLFFSSLAWGLASYFLAGELLNDQNQRGTIELFVFTLLFAVFVFLVLFGWASWNKLLYGGLDRRKPRPMPSDEAVAEHHHVSIADLHLAKNAKMLNVLCTESVFQIEARHSLLDAAKQSLEREKVSGEG